MTNEEAIKAMTKYMPKDNDSVSLVLREAMNMGINALEQIPDLKDAYDKPKTDVLDKIRAEIESEPYVSKMEVLDIIDKYKAESEEVNG